MDIYIVDSHHQIDGEPWKHHHGVKLNREDFERGLQVWVPADGGQLLRRGTLLHRSENEASYVAALHALDDLSIPDGRAVISLNMGGIESGDGVLSLSRQLITTRQV